MALSDYALTLVPTVETELDITPGSDTARLETLIHWVSKLFSSGYTGANGKMYPEKIEGLTEDEAVSQSLVNVGKRIVTSLRVRISVKKVEPVPQSAYEEQIV